MFSWICARCGRDNPPSVTNCLKCGARYDDPVEPELPAVAEEAAPEYETAPEYEEYYEEEEPQAVAPPPPPPPPPPPRPPIRRPVPRPPAPVAAAPPPAVRPPAARPLPPRPVPVVRPPEPVRSGLPTWLMTILFFFAIVGIGAAIYYGIDYGRNRKVGPSTAAAPTPAGAHSNPLQKYLEVVGIRLVQDAKRKPEARFVVVNHSAEVLDDLTATVTLRASTSRSEEDSVGNFTFNVSSLGAFSSKDVTAPLTTKLKFYELPDWQNLTAEVSITSP